MSELRDLAAVMRSLHNSLTSIENHVANQDANGAQLRLGLHDLRDKLHSRGLEEEERARETASAIKQIQVWMGSFSDRLRQLADDVTAGFRQDRASLRALKGDEDETTQP